MNPKLTKYRLKNTEGLKGIRVTSGYYEWSQITDSVADTMQAMQQASRYLEKIEQPPIPTGKKRKSAPTK